VRLHHFVPAELDADQQRLYDALTTGQRRQVHDALPSAVHMTDSHGRLQGPFNAMLVHPKLGLALQELSRQLRFEGTLSARTREIVILIVAASEQSDFEWAAHAPISISVGVDPQVVDAIARSESPDFTDPQTDAAARMARALVAHGDLDEDTYQSVQSVLGENGVFEVSTTVGVYQLIAQQLRLFRVDAPAGPWSLSRGG
jgi:4-carboxymuconolactone decarboxylase